MLLYETFSTFANGKALKSVLDSRFIPNKNSPAWWPKKTLYSSYFCTLCFLFSLSLVLQYVYFLQRFSFSVIRFQDDITLFLLIAYGFEQMKGSFRSLKMFMYTKNRFSMKIGFEFIRLFDPIWKFSESTACEECVNCFTVRLLKTHV